MPRSVLLSNRTTTLTTPVVWARSYGPGNTTLPNQVFTAEVSGIGNCVATVTIYGTNDSVDGGAPVGQLVATITATGTAADVTPGTANYVSQNAAWGRFGAAVTGISGTQAAVTVVMNH